MNKVVGMKLGNVEVRECDLKGHKGIQVLRDGVLIAIIHADGVISLEAEQFKSYVVDGGIVMFFPKGVDDGGGLSAGDN